MSPKTIAGWLMTVFAFVLAIDSRPVVAGGDPDGKQDVAAAGELPEGCTGVASQFDADIGIESHREVVFADSFEAADFRQRWDSVRDESGEVLRLIDQSNEDERLGERTLQVTATLGKNTGGGLTKWFVSAETVHIRFYTKFDSSCDYIHHFCTLRANRSLEGKGRWSGFGGAGLRPEGDERFSTALEPWGNWGRWPPPGRWNFYSYWHQMAQSGDGHYWGNAFRPARQQDIPRGKWICAEFMLRHNTAGRDDGEQAFWIDGRLRGHWKGISWRTSPDLWANAFTLESYVTDRWTDQPVNRVFFDNVVIAREYIGPMPVSGSDSESDRQAVVPSANER